MGLFDRLKSKKEQSRSKKQALMHLLSEININPYDYEHESMEAAEISLNDELEGAIKCSEYFGNNIESNFDYISLVEYDNGTRYLYMAMNNRNPRETRDLVDKCHSTLGDDFLDQGRFTSYDLDLYQQEENGTIRSWFLTFFEVNIGFINKDDFFTTYVMITEKDL